MDSERGVGERLLDHYEVPGLLARIDAGLAALGEDPAAPRPESLARFDEFHVRGRAATRDLIALLDVSAGDAVLDVGAGLGGPARQLAAATGARVTGIDLSPVYCEVAHALTARVGLDGAVRFRCQSVAAAADGGPDFDAAWTIHVGMNVAHKPAFYAAVHRCLKPGGRFLVYDILAGPGGDPVYPLPWARSAGESFLASPEAMDDALRAGRFAVELVRDDTAAALAFMQGAAARTQAADRSAPLGLHTVLGDSFREIQANLLAALTSGAVAVGLFVCSKSGAAGR